MPPPLWPVLKLGIALVADHERRGLWPPWRPVVTDPNSMLGEALVSKVMAPGAEHDRHRFGATAGMVVGRRRMSKRLEPPCGTAPLCGTPFMSCMGPGICSHAPKAEDKGSAEGKNPELAGCGHIDSLMSSPSREECGSNRAVRQGNPTMSVCCNRLSTKLTRLRQVATITFSDYNSYSRGRDGTASMVGIDAIPSGTSSVSY